MIIILSVNLSSDIQILGRVNIFFWAKYNVFVEKYSIPVICVLLLLLNMIDPI